MGLLKWVTKSVGFSCQDPPEFPKSVSFPSAFRQLSVSFPSPFRQLSVSFPSAFRQLSAFRVTRFRLHGSGPLKQTAAFS